MTTAERADSAVHEDDDFAWTKEAFARAEGPASLSPAELAAFPRTAARLGRPADSRKVPVSLRLDPFVVEAFKAEGEGWQTRMNAVLADHVKKRA